MCLVLLGFNITDYARAEIIGGRQEGDPDVLQLMEGCKIETPGGELERIYNNTTGLEEKIAGLKFQHSELCYEAERKHKGLKNINPLFNLRQARGEYKELQRRILEISEKIEQLQSRQE